MDHDGPSSALTLPWGRIPLLVMIGTVINTYDIVPIDSIDDTVERSKHVMAAVE
jgi:hypothetical protein